MIIQITGRHVEITDAIRGYVNDRLMPTLNDYPSVEHAHVILDVEKFRHLAGIVIQGKNRLRVESSSETDDMYKSIDSALEKIDRQLRRARDKRLNYKASDQRERLADREIKPPIE